MIGHFNNYIQIYWRTPKKRTYTEFGLSLLLVIVFLVFAIRPTIITAGELYKTNQEAKIKVEKLEQKIVSIAQAKAAFRQEQDRLKYIEKALPKDPQALTLLDQLSFVAREDNLTVVEAGLSSAGISNNASDSPEFNPLPESYQGQTRFYNLGTIAFTMRLTGNFLDLKKFLQEVENFPRIINLAEVEFDQTQEASNKLFLNLKGLAYIEPSQNE